MATASLISPVGSKHEMPSRELEAVPEPEHLPLHHQQQQQRLFFLPPSSTLRDIDIDIDIDRVHEAVGSNNSHQYDHNDGNDGVHNGIHNDKDSLIRTVWRARSQTLDNSNPIVLSAAPKLASRFSRFSTPPKRRDLTLTTSTASLIVTPNTHSDPDPHQPHQPGLAGLALDNLLDLDCAFGRPPHLPASQAQPLYTTSPERYSSIDSQLSASTSPPIDTDLPLLLQPHNHPAAADDEARLDTSLDNLSDAPSDYDDPTANDTSSATDIDDNPDNASGFIELLYDDGLSRSSSPMFAPKPSPPHLRLEQVNPAISQQEGPRTLIDDSPQSTSFGPLPVLNKPLPRSPDHRSTLPSVFGWGGAASPDPLATAHNGLAHDGRRSTKGSFASDHNKYADTYLSMPSPSSPAFSISHTASMVDEMEDELKAISAELAASIRREMDLEDLVDRLQDQVSSSSQGLNKRSSDYFSDSGHSATKLSDTDAGREEIDKIRRRSEQEKASIRLELSNKLQDERSKRTELNRKIKELAEKASHVDIAQINSLDANDRIKTLEETCDDLKRKLSEERESKGGFEDILSALKAQLQEVSDERDNLKDEVIPGLRTRIEGLETAATGHSDLTYESARLQQQLQSLQRENSSLRSSMVSVSGPPEEPAKRMSLGLSRSNSLGPSALRGGPRKPPPPVLSRTDSFKGAAVPGDTREDLAQKLKDAELQRDALHGAVKTLLERLEFQDREHMKKVRALESERQRLLNPSRKVGFERDTSKLRVEVNVLRRRAEEALEQKWQVEKGLGGLKMDLDRAVEEIESLRNLLKEEDILVAPLQFRTSVYSSSGQPVSSESLERALGELRSAQADSDAGEESAKRMEDVAVQVEQQLTANSELRERFSAAVTIRETDRTAHSQRISEMQELLRSLEDQVVNAQMASEERVTRHEEEMAKMQESHRGQLRRLQMDPRKGAKGSRVSVADLSKSLRPIPSRSFEDEAEIKALRSNVAELEKTLADAENEMEGIVARMNKAQAEVLHLQEAREAAVRETRRLEQVVRQEHAGLGGLLERS